MHHFEWRVPTLIVFALLLALSPGSIYSQTPSEQSAPKAPSTQSAPAMSMEQVVNKIIERERLIVRTLTKFSPLVETYLQNLERDDELYAVPKSDKYYLAKLDLSKDAPEVLNRSLLPAPSIPSKFKDRLTQFYSVRYLPAGFSQMMMLDPAHFDRQTYDFEYVRREFLGEVRCLVFDIKPKKPEKGRFSGRIWVEDQEYSIVRFNGTYGLPKSSSKLYFHFDSWRENMGPNVWLPAYVYSEESDLKYFLGRRNLRFKGQTRIWGYNIGKSNQQDEFTALTVEADHVKDNVDQAEGMSPVLSLRAWERQAEDNMLQRMEKAGLLAPEGEVDKILQTVITNLEVTNNLRIEPVMRARVLLTSPLESFAVGHTIVVSRGLIDVLPDEASLAMVLAHELGHIISGHRLDTKYAFNDRMLFEDEESFRRLRVKREEKEEEEADRKAAALLKNSPYKDKLGNAGLFLRAMDERAAGMPALLRAHMGDHMVRDSEVVRMATLMQSAPALKTTSTDQIAALPLGGRIKVNPWNNTIELMKNRPVELLTAREKMPFEVTPVFLYLTRQQPADTKQAAAAQTSSKQ